jgi:separase
MQIECKRVKDVDERADSPSLYSLLSSSTELSKRDIGIILEQVQSLCRHFLRIETS